MRIANYGWCETVNYEGESGCGLFVAAFTWRHADKMSLALEHVSLRRYAGPQLVRAHILIMVNI
jgi:hypothetical protein